MRLHPILGNQLNFKNETASDFLQPSFSVSLAKKNTLRNLATLDAFSVGEISCFRIPSSCCPDALITFLNQRINSLNKKRARPDCREAPSSSIPKLKGQQRHKSKNETFKLRVPASVASKALIQEHLYRVSLSLCPKI